MLRVEIWIFTTLFALGVIGGMTYLNLQGYSLAPTQSVGADTDDGNKEQGFLSNYASDNDSELNSRPNSGLTETRKSPLDLGDRYLVTGNFELALDYYYEFEKSSGDSGARILLREAFCCELQKEFDQAEKKYYLAITRAANEAHRLLGIAGFARCLAHSGKQFEAREILVDQALKLDRFKLVPEEVRAQLVFQLAKAIEASALGKVADLTEPHGVVFDNPSPRPEVFLKVADQRHEPTPQLDELPDASIEILQRPSSSLNVITASISANLEPVEMMLARLATAAQLNLRISPNASSMIRNRSKTIALDAVPLSHVFDKLLTVFDLVWYQLDSDIHIVTQSEVDPAISTNQFQFDAAHRAHRSFELNFPDNERRPSALLSRANMYLVQKNYDKAANLYQELAQIQPREAMLAKLFFNRAKLRVLLNRHQDANRLFYLAVDQTFDPNIEAAAYSLLGSNLLSAGELEETIKVSRRALTTAVDPKQKQHASLNLARAYLLNKDPFSANNILFRNREYYEGSSAKPVASILGAYARFIGISDDRGIEVARIRLLSAISMMPESDYISFADSYIASQAYQHLGFREKAVKHLVLALAKPDIGQWRRQIMFELAGNQKRLGQVAEATSTLRYLTESDDHWTLDALQELAKIYFETDQIELCIETSKRLWQTELDEDQKRNALTLLGSAYQKKGEHHTAALCFAGILPDTF